MPVANKMHISERGRCGNQRRILASPFMTSRTGTLSEIQNGNLQFALPFQKLTG